MTLYETLGGQEAIEQVVDDFYNRVMADDTVNHFFANTDMKKQRRHPVVPVLGQGGNMAFEDAYELAECLAHAPSLETALCAYEHRRIPRTEEIYIHSAIRGARAYQPDSERSYLVAGLLTKSHKARHNLHFPT